MNTITVSKMKRKILVFALCIPLVVQAQNKNQNYVKETIHLDGTGTITNVKYFNGIGDLVEVASTNCGSNTSIFTFVTYDSKKRKHRVYNAAPHSGKSLDFMNKADFEKTSYNFYKDNYAYSEAHYDTDDRIIREDIGGKLWHSNNKSNTSTYGTNTVADKVIFYSDPINNLSLTNKKLDADSLLLSEHTTTPIISSQFDKNITASPIIESIKLDKEHISSSVINTQYYPAGSLEKVTTKDADGNMFITFKDLHGNIILERRSEGDTYYVYSKLGQLRYVLLPKFQEKGDLAAYAYQYEYDKRGNLIKKTLPGAKYVQYWYDKEGHLVFKQDAQLREKQLYRFYIYDEYERMVVSGTSPKCKTNVENSIIKSSYSSTSPGFMNTGYSFNSDCISTIGATIEKVYYYDTYNFLSGSHTGDFRDITPTVKDGVNGLLAGSIVIASNGEYVYTVNCYDPKGNLINCFVKSINGYTAKTTNTYSITNKLKSAVTEVDVKYGKLLNISEINEYSSVNDKVINKIITLFHGVKDCTASIQYKYDPFNKISKIIRPNQAGIVKYAYDDVHGWPISIESNSFKENIFYANGLGMPCYSGNISSIRWKTNNYERERGYKFYYDKLNRLSNAIYGEGSNLTDAANRYNESIKYDLNSNITSLKRHGKKQDGSYGVVDDLTITLNGNQLQEVTDKADKNVYKGALDFNNAAQGKSTYRYNDLGALISDTGRGIAMIEYDNFMNPIRIQFSNGNVTKYIYSAEGLKLRAVYYTAMPNIHVAEGTTHNLTTAEILSVDSMDYLMEGKLILKNARIDTYLFDGGYGKAEKPVICITRPNLPISLDDDDDVTISQQEMEEYQERLKEWQKAMTAYQAQDVFKFYYFNKDHLGNNREVTDEMGDISQEINYYPFGNPYFDAYNETNADFQPFKYNEKEFDMMHGLNTYDYGARQYNPIVPSWDRIDPLCELFRGISPYAYCQNNPIVLVDVNGMFPTYIDAKRYAMEHGATLQNIRYAKDKEEWFVAFGADGKGYLSGGTLERRFSAKVSETDWWRALGEANTNIGVGLGFAGWGLAKPLARSNAYAFRDATGKYINSAKPTFRFKNIDIDFNLRGANKVASGIKYLGWTGGFVSGGMITIEMIQGQKNIIGEGGLDLLMTGVGFVPGYGWAISSTYFIGKGVLEYYDLDFWNK